MKMGEPKVFTLPDNRPASYIQELEKVIKMNPAIIMVVIPNNKVIVSYYPQRAQRAGGIVRVWQIFGHGYDSPTWSELGTKSKVKVTYFEGKKYLEEFKKYL